MDDKTDIVPKQVSSYTEKEECTTIQLTADPTPRDSQSVSKDKNVTSSSGTVPQVVVHHQKRPDITIAATSNLSSIKAITNANTIESIKEENNKIKYMMIDIETRLTRIVHLVNSLDNPVNEPKHKPIFYFNLNNKYYITTFLHVAILNKMPSITGQGTEPPDGLIAVWISENSPINMCKKSTNGIINIDTLLVEGLIYIIKTIVNIAPKTVIDKRKLNKISVHTVYQNLYDIVYAYRIGALPAISTIDIMHKKELINCMALLEDVDIIVSSNTLYHGFKMTNELMLKELGS